MSTSMETHHQHDSMGNNDDQAMGGVDDNMATTPTGGYGHGYQNGRRQSAQSTDYQTTNAPLSPSQEDPSARYPSNSSYQQQPMAQPYSRPSSGLSGSHSQTYQDQNQRSGHAGVDKGQNSVVIKVGMVGDAQIGKTSLMVKYVEGSWDEDYIQTLGKPIYKNKGANRDLANLSRCQLHGKDHIDTKHRNYIFDLGSRRSTRVRQHATPRLQRRRRHPLHVRPHQKEHPELDQRMV